MSYAFETALYQRIRSELNKVPIIDCHEHLQRESELPTGDQAHIGRFFMHYASCDLVSAGMPLAEMTRVQDGTNGLSATERWAFLKPWYCKARNTAYFDALRIAFRDLYGVEDLADDTVEPLTATMRRQIRPGFTRAVFNKAGIDYAMNNPFTPKPIFNPDYGTDCFIVDMFDDFTTFPIARLAEDSGLDIKCLGDYLQVIDFYFARDGHCASAFKVSRAYDRPLIWDDVARSTVEGTFNRLLVANDCLDQQSIHALEDFIMHYLVRKCGEYDLRLKFHTGFQGRKWQHHHQQPRRDAVQLVPAVPEDQIRHLSYLLSLPGRSDGYHQKFPKCDHQFLLQLGLQPCRHPARTVRYARLHPGK